MANNVFLFDDKHFTQPIGTVMGTKVEPSYANLTIVYLEENLFDRIIDSYDNVTANTIKQIIGGDTLKTASYNGIMNGVILKNFITF